MIKGAPKLGTISTLSIGIGGMVGGGIFAVTGLTIEVTKGGAPVAFLIAGVVALLTSYSYLRLTLRYPSEGGTVEFLNRAFGGGIFTGAANILLLFTAVNIANCKLARETGSRVWMSGLAAFCTAAALVILCVKVDENPATRNHLWILVGMIAASLVIEMLYRRVSGRQIRLVTTRE
jgi:amino acid transporter